MDWIPFFIPVRHSAQLYFWRVLLFYNNYTQKNWNRVFLRIAAALASFFGEDEAADELPVYFFALLTSLLLIIGLNFETDNGIDDEHTSMFSKVCSHVIL